MGVKTVITLEGLNRLFLSYNFTEILPTSSGVIDTTYIVSNAERSFILKKYERDIQTEVDSEIQLLHRLKLSALNVPTLIERSDSWYLYNKLEGQEPRVIKSYHIQALARFMAKLHTQTYNMNCSKNFVENYPLESILNFTKVKYFLYFKKLQHLKNYKPKNDGLIHGDIFKDNTIFNKAEIGVFDFIDAACGEFVFDIAVALVAFSPKKASPYFLNLFLNTYNQHAPKKIQKEMLTEMLQIAAAFYALLRIQMYKNTKKAKELL